MKHNVAHHTYTNIDGFDDDITQIAARAVRAGSARAAVVPVPALYIWPLYMLMGLRWQTVGDIAAFARGRIGESALRVSARLEPRRRRRPER